jgi:hypothetical protein
LISFKAEIPQDGTATSSKTGRILETAPQFHENTKFHDNVKMQIS